MTIRSAASGIVSRRRTGAAGTKLLGAIGMAALGGPALAGEASDQGEGATTVKPVTVEAGRRPLDRDTGLAVLPGSLQDTPQAIQVIGERQLREQGVTTLEQALRNVPGITIAIGEGGSLNAEPANKYGVPHTNFLDNDTDRDQNHTDNQTERYHRRVSPSLTLTSD